MHLISLRVIGKIWKKKFHSHFLFILIKRQCNKNGQASDVNSRWEFLHVFSCFWQQLKLKCRWWHCKAVKTNFLVAFLIVSSTFPHYQQCLSARPKQPQKQQKTTHKSRLKSLQYMYSGGKCIPMVENLTKTNFKDK